MKCLIVITLVLSFSIAAIASDADSPIIISYQYQSKTVEIEGHRVSNTSYVFNPSGSPLLKLATLDWPPYISNTLCNQGWVQQVTVALLTSQGYGVHISFFPWARSVSLVERGHFDILFPEYYIENTAPSDAVPNSLRVENLALSTAIPGGDIALLKRKNSSSKYQGRLSNLKGANIGVVRGYQNTPEFDALMDQGFFNIEKSVDDATNALKLTKNRVDYIVGDPLAINFSVRHHPKLSALQKKEVISSIETIKPALQNNPLYYAVSTKRPRWQQSLSSLNKAIEIFTTSGEIQRLIQLNTQQCEREKEISHEEGQDNASVN